MRSRRVMAVLALVSTVTLAAQSPAPPRAGRADTLPNILPFRATETTLANGLKVIVVPTGFPNLVSLQIPVQTGSRNEVEPGKSGFAHFFEHLMFRGTPNTPPDVFQAVMSKAGARDNAGTGDDATHFYATFAKEDLDTVLRVYADMFQNLSYSESDFKTEARAILGEYNKNSADPMQKLSEVERARFYQSHTYKHTTMGFIQDIENMPNEYAYSKVFFDRWYRPQFTTVIVAGDVTAQQVLPMIEKYWGPWKASQAGTAAPTAIPKEPPPNGPKYVHVPWDSETLPIISIGFPGPAFDENGKDTAAMEMIAALSFDRTSDLYKKLVVTEQKVDSLRPDPPSNVDPSMFTVVARVKRAADVPYVRDEILKTIAQARASTVTPARLADAKSFGRYSLARTFDSTERVASITASYVSFRRSFDTINNYFRTIDAITPADLQAAARKYFTDSGLIVTTLSQGALPADIERLPSLGTVAPPVAAATADVRKTPPPLTVATPAGRSNARGIPLELQKSVLPQLNIKLLFTVGSAHDPAGKEGLAALTAAMMTRAGSKALTIEEIQAALYPMAGSFGSQTDKEMTTFTGVIHKDRWQTFLSIGLPQLLSPGLREEDFRRLKDAQLNALVQDLRSNNEEELGKERLQVNIFRGTPYGHPALGTVAGIRAITLDDVKQFAQTMYTRANLTIGISGDAPDNLIRLVQASMATLPEGPAAPAPSITPSALAGVEVEIIEKDTRATAMSLGFPIDVRRGDPDFAALSVARAWLGEHRISSGKLYQRIREIRGMNYGDYAYIEAFPRGMFQFFPDPNIVRRRQLFEIWIRPVVPANAHMALRIAVREFRDMVQSGLTKEAFETTRDYLMKNVYVMTARQDQQLGYALDSRFYKIGEFTKYMRDALQALTVDRVNAALKQHLPTDRLSVVIIAKDATALKQALSADSFSAIRYDGEKPKALLDEDQTIGALRLNIAADRIRITPVADVFGK